MAMPLTKMCSVISLSATQSLRRNSFYRPQLFKVDFYTISVWFLFKGFYKENCWEELHQSGLRHFIFLAYSWILFVVFFSNMVLSSSLCLQPMENIRILLCHLMSARIVLNDKVSKTGMKIQTLMSTKRHYIYRFVLWETSDLKWWKTPLLIPQLFV